MAKIYLPDINVWLALAFDVHVHHPIAKRWFDTITADVCLFCRLTQLHFLRLATNKSVFKGEALKLDEAWHAYELFLSDPRISFADEPPDIETHWRSVTAAQKFSPSIWNDSYLAAFAMSRAAEVVTLDKGFLQYGTLSCTVLQAT
jgi:toxin-antitoxin system PIN domain toxin